MPLTRNLLSAAQFDRKLPQLRAAAENLAKATPPTGWIKVLRQSLGLTAAAMARRLRIRPQSAIELESGEAAGTITLASLRRVANVLDADVIYALIPRRSLRNIIADRAQQVARERLSHVAHSMRLEAQGLPQKELDEQIDELARDLERRPRELWR